MEQTKSRISELSTDLVEQWFNVGGSAYYLRTASVMDVLDTAYQNGLELRLIPVDKNLDTSYNLDNQEGIYMSNESLRVFNRIVTELQASGAQSEQKFEITTKELVFHESYTMIGGQKVVLKREEYDEYEICVEETDNISTWIYQNS